MAGSRDPPHIHRDVLRHRLCGERAVWGGLEAHHTQQQGCAMAHPHMSCRWDVLGAHPPSLREQGSTPEDCMGHGAYQVTTLGGCSPRQGQGQGQHTQRGSRLWSAQRLWWWVELTHPPGGQAHTKGDIRPGGLGSHPRDSDLSQAGEGGRQVRSR